MIRSFDSIRFGSILFMNVLHLLLVVLIIYQWDFECAIGIQHGTALSSSSAAASAAAAATASATATQAAETTRLIHKNNDSNGGSVGMG